VTTTTMTAAPHLITVATHWRHLEDALGTPSVTSWPPSGLRNYLGSLEREDEAEAATWRAKALRALERSPEQIGRTEPPLRLAIFDTMQTVTDDLTEMADAIAAVVQFAPLTPAPARRWPADPKARRILEAEDARRNLLAQRQANDPRRWRYTMGERTAVRAALWLCARVQGVRGPWRPLTEKQHAEIASVASVAAQRVERALDLAARSEPLARPCPCGGRINVHGGRGASPLAHCTGCGRVWTEQGVAA